MEAQVAGKLVVASNVGGIPEMVHEGKTGFLFAGKNSSDLAAKLDFVLSNGKLCEQVAEQGRKWGLHQWSPSTLFEKTLNVYRSALQ
jgi:glycosyltransferase involved in cell wall biosynthesis